MRSSDTVDLQEDNLEQMGLSPEVRTLLGEIKASVDEQYRARFLEMAQSLHLQAATLARIQTTLSILVEHLAPALMDRVPVAFRVAGDGEEADLASALLTADPIGAGYVLTQADIARALQVSEVDASNLIRAFGFRDDPDLAIRVRRGKGKELFNYHSRTVERLLSMVRSPPSTAVLSPVQQQALVRVRRAVSGLP